MGPPPGMIGPMELVTPRLLLREFRNADQPAVHAYASDPEVTRYTDGGPNSPAATAAFLAETERDAAAQPRTEYTLAVTDRVDDVVIGAVHLSLTSQTHQRGDMGYVLGRPRWGQGYATEAATAILRFGFDQVGLHKIAASCDPGNLASARLLSKIGMRPEGHLHHHLLIQGQWRDRLLFAAISPLR